jgi:hypothetical protein
MPPSSPTSTQLATSSQADGQAEWYENGANCRSHGWGKRGIEASNYRAVHSCKFTLESSFAMRLNYGPQFHPSSPDWRTILWFSIDYPPPPTAPKHAIGDVNTLPWSYTFSSVPDILREGAETPLSKYYTIPSTEPVPFPSLPISFPNLAMYLTAALEHSRSAINDSSSNGVRKLSRMIDQCYPSAFDEPRSPEKKSFGGRLKTFIGVGAKNVNKPRGLNEDTYDLVTPFVADEWG